MEHVYLLLTRGGPANGDDTYIMFMKDHKPTYWRIQGAFSAEKAAEKAKEKLDPKMIEASIYKISLERNKWWP